MPANDEEGLTPIHVPAANKLYPIPRTSAAALNAFTQNPDAPDEFMAWRKRRCTGKRSFERGDGAAELDALFTAIPADAPLGTTPKQRLLMLQRDLLTTVQEESIKLKEKTSWNIGAHVDLGSHDPFSPR